MADIGVFMGSLHELHEMVEMLYLPMFTQISATKSQEESRSNLVLKGVH
jgi:hypothetical protein